MWDYDEFLGKAQLYFGRAEEHPAVDDEVTGIWLLLGLEFLLRAPLARVAPTLLAEPDSIMAAAGFPSKPGASKPKSIQTKTVIGRLGQAIPEFGAERQEEALALAGLRNEELHSSSSPFSRDSLQWIPSFTRVAEVICKHLGLDVEAVVGKEIISQGRMLAREADQKLLHEVNKRIAAAKQFLSHLKPEELSARTNSIPSHPFQGPFIPSRATLDPTSKTVVMLPPAYLVPCPGCANDIPMELQAVRKTNERLEDEETIAWDVLYVGVSLNCPVCDLKLDDTAEIRAAGVPVQQVIQQSEDLAERYASAFEEPDYGND